MNIYPAIDIRHGKVVQLVGGDPDKVGVESERTPAQQAAHWKKQGARMVHVIDLDGAIDGHKQWPLVGRILSEGVRVQFGGGIRHMVDIQKLIDMGVHRIIIGTQGVQNPDWLREVAHLFPDRIVLAVDARGRDVQVKGWTEGTGKDVVELCASLDDAGLAGFLFTDVEVEGSMSGVRPELVRALRDATPNTRLIISGGIKDEKDLHVLDGLGVDAVVLGMSIYTDAIDVQNAVERFEKEATP